MRATVAAAVIAVLAGAGATRASERHFTYVQESNVLSPGLLELEPWVTVRLGREGFYSEFDHRIELEAGIVDNVQASLYLNVAGVAEDIGVKRALSTVWQGISGEVKWKLMDATADAFGLALYFEPSIGPASAELEGKVIVDKRFGDFLAAANLVLAHEWEWDHADALENESEIEAVGGLTYFIVPEVSAGLELRDLNEIEWKSDGPEVLSTIFAGPVVTWMGPRLWISATLLPQIAAPLGATSGAQNLEDHERFEGRLVFGLHL